MVKAKEWLSFWGFAFSYSMTFILIILDFTYLKLVTLPFIVIVSSGFFMFTSIVSRLITQRQLGKYFSVNIKIHKQHQLIQSGMYRYVRHPMYLFNIIIFLGLAGMFSSILGIMSTLLLVVPTTLFRIKREEYFLLEKFGNKYKQYQQKTKKLIPLLL
tara:strand:- start:2769 stop:3242 length:474 start_codon:yes stop_codon:yes gene_type:complete